MNVERLDDIGPAWERAIANPDCAAHRRDARPCHDIVVTGDDAHGPGHGLEVAADPDFDAGLRRRALSDRDLRDHHAIPTPASRTWAPIAAMLKGADAPRHDDAGPTCAPAGSSIGRSIQGHDEPMPIAIVLGCAAAGRASRGRRSCASTSTSSRVAGGLAGGPINVVKAKTVDLLVPAEAEIVIEGYVDPDYLEPEGPFGESHGYVALEDYNLRHRRHRDHAAQGCGPHLDHHAR